MQGYKRWRKNFFIIQLPHSLFLVQYLKQPHISSQAGGLMVCSLAGREREHKRWRKKFLHHSTSSVLVPCSIFKTTPYQFPGQRPNGMLTRGTRARTKTMAKKSLHHSSSSFLVPCSIFKTTSYQFPDRRPNVMLTLGTRARTQAMADTN